MDVKQGVIAWEKLRLTYNGVLLLVGLPLLLLFYNDLKLEVTDTQIIDGVIAAVMVANALYFIGPLIEIYSMAFLNWSWSQRQRRVLFGIGLALSILALLVGFGWILFLVALSTQ